MGVDKGAWGWMGEQGRAYSRAPDKLHSESYSALVAAAELVQGRSYRNLLQTYSLQYMVRLHRVGLPFTVTEWPSKDNLLQECKAT